MEDHERIVHFKESDRCRALRSCLWNFEVVCADVFEAERYGNDTAVVAELGDQLLVSNLPLFLIF